MLLAYGIFSAVAQNNDLGSLPVSISLSGFSGDSRKRKEKKKKTNAEICAGWFGLQLPLGQGGGLVTQLPSESSLLLKSETHA